MDASSRRRASLSRQAVAAARWVAAARAWSRAARIAVWAVRAASTASSAAATRVVSAACSSTAWRSCSSVPDSSARDAFRLRESWLSTGSISATARWRSSRE